MSAQVLPSVAPRPGWRWSRRSLRVAGCGDDDDESASTSAAATTTVGERRRTDNGGDDGARDLPRSHFDGGADERADPRDDRTAGHGGTAATSPCPATRWRSPRTIMANPFMLERVGVFGGLVVYDGESVDGDFKLRCVAVGHDGETTWSEWCALPGDSSSFIVVEGINPWVVDVGAEHLDVKMTQMPSDWAVTSSGCVDPIVTLIDAAEIAPAVATSIACAGGDAFMTYSSVYMQPGPPDGGGLLLTNGDEGWNTDGGGTSILCTDCTDGVDRCAEFGVDGELFEATSPIPSPDQLAAQQDYIAVREVTADVQAMAADAPDIDAITDAIVAALTPPDPEAAPAMTRHDGVYFNQYSLLVVDVPALDDSVGSTTWAVWITTETPELPSTVHRAYAWDNCTRGLADSDLR